MPPAFERSRMTACDGHFRLLTSAFAMAFLIGCQKPVPQETYNLPSKDDLFNPTLVLTEHDDEQILALMRAAVPSETEAEILPARYGVRWSDVDPAVRWGTSVVLMAVLQATLEDDRWVFEIITAADEPVTLTITREPPPTIYRAEAVAGLFGDRQDIVDRLLPEVHLAMKRYGQKPQPTALDDRAVDPATGSP